MALTSITVLGARERNLNGVNISRDTLAVVACPTESGKSDLAFDTRYSKGQRRYIEPLSA